MNHSFPQRNTLTEPAILLGKNLNFYKAQAAKLHKQIKQSDLILQSDLNIRLAQFNMEYWLESPSTVKRKQVLNLIALENGFANWQALKSRVELETALDFQTFFCRHGLGGYLNHWFTNYAEAKAHQNAYGGILLPYRQQFFVTPINFLDKLGFDQSDEEWRAIGFDWVVPKSNRAKLRIIKTIVTQFTSEE
ncbi:hypothetical protein FLL45_19115 [Aliikangiella marina]|uniref:Uncharacterized protein n=1 Tax=Aliikangiella marina TaxID=1712262 RepID=A0A545T539_9GAMM|nr:hypothetical protein [Aliikangiella marina]TQV72329.1 hypothetical protein FLL45_19115 [Aliikangiella marina]